MDHASGEEDIAAMWQEHFQKLLNSTPHSQKRQSILDKLEHCSSLDDPITAMEVTEAIKNLKTGKSCGHDKLQGEHFKNSSHRAAVLLSMCFNSMIVHGHVSKPLMDTVLVPIIKDKKGDVTSADNYRPIALTTVSSKLFELIFLSRFQSYLNTTDNQFLFL